MRKSRLVPSVAVALAVIAGVTRAQPTEPDSTGTVRVEVRTATGVEQPGLPLANAVVRAGHISAKTGATGEVRFPLPTGLGHIVVMRIGFVPDSLDVVVRAGADTIVIVALQAQAEELERVVVQSTRGQRRVEDEPTRVEVLDHEEVEEQTAMNPGDVARFLSEAGGVRTQTTSAALGSANLRVQGLRGRYTELLSDGLPLYGLTTEGLGLLQIPPIDLQQIELIKGAASALYGPTALGGVIDFVSRRPGSTPTRELFLNQTTQDATDAAFFASQPLGGTWGGTLLATANRQRRLDQNGDGWADVPSYQRAAVRPRLFWTGATGSTLFVTTGITGENRAGGTLPHDTVPSGGSFPVDQSTRRADVGSVAHLVLADELSLSLRGSVTSEWRDLRIGGPRERDNRNTEFGEAALTLSHGAQEIVVGAAYQRDGFDSRDRPVLDYAFNAPAVFAQHTWTPARWFAVTSSARIDSHNVYGTIVSPRVSALARFGRGWTARLSGGLGAYTPTPFVEEAEEIGFARLRPLVGLSAERVRSAQADVTGAIGAVEVSASLYASVIDHAIDIRAVPPTGDSVQLVNGPTPTRTQGAEIFARHRIGRYTITATYDFRHATEANVDSGGRRNVPLTPNHAAGLTAVWEPRDDTGLGLEGFYTGHQSLQYDPYRSESKPYLLVGALARWRIGRVLLWLNGEDLNNVRQTHTDPLLRPRPGLGGRWTTDVWAPLDGAVVNGGARIEW